MWYFSEKEFATHETQDRGEDRHESHGSDHARSWELGPSNSGQFFYSELSNLLSVKLFPDVELEQTNAGKDLIKTEKESATILTSAQINNSIKRVGGTHFS